MIFYGSKASRLKDGRINNVTCPSCENQTSMTYAIFGKYGHIYWIPLFPMEKETVIECNHCKKTYKTKELPEAIKQKMISEKQGVRTPFWNYSGLLIIAALIIFGMYNGAKQKENETLYLENPQAGDVYSTKTEDYDHYSSMKVIKVTTDSVYVVYNDYEIDKKSSINKIDKDENYTTEYDHFSKEEISTLYTENMIYAIDRD